MSLKAILFDFNGVVINDEPIHDKLLADLLIGENLNIVPKEIRQLCLGKSDRSCLSAIFERQGRFVTEAYLSLLIKRKSAAYQQALANLAELPIYPSLPDFLARVKEANWKTALVSGSVRSDIELVLSRSGLWDSFDVIISSDEVAQGKPDPEGYLLAVAQLNQLDPDLHLQPGECLAIEDTFPGIQAAKRAGIPVVGVAHTYPFHFMQRVADWATDTFADLELDRIQEFFAKSVDK